MRKWNKGELVAEIPRVLNSTPTTVGANYTAAELLVSLNQVYSDIVEEAKQSAAAEHFIARSQIVWPANQNILELNDNLVGKEIRVVYDITDSQRPTILDIGNNPVEADIYWISPTALKWYNGPSAEKTLLFEVYTCADEMVEDDDEPVLIPRQFRNVLVWGTAIYQRDIQDERTPGPWNARYLRLLEAYIKHISRLRPNRIDSNSGLSYSITLGATPTEVLDTDNDS